MFRYVVGSLKGNIKPALCKEDKTLWKTLGMKFDGCHCLLGCHDGIAKERETQMKQTKSIGQITGLGKSLPILA